jgi:hypothetical protein
MLPIQLDQLTLPGGTHTNDCGAAREIVDLTNELTWPLGCDKHFNIT